MYSNGTVTSRRNFIRGAGAAVVIAPSMLMLEGCNTDIVNILNTVLASAQAVLAVAEPGASWLGSYQSAVAALQAAEAQWQAGSPIQIVESALNTLASVTAAIPLTAAYSPLIDVLVAGIDAVLTAISSKTKTPTPTPAAPTPAAPVAARAPNPHRDKVHLTPGVKGVSSVSAYKAQWNAVVAANPALIAAKLH